jgi:hypothetical protein
LLRRCPLVKHAQKTKSPTVVRRGESGGADAEEESQRLRGTRAITEKARSRGGVDQRRVVRPILRAPAAYERRSQPSP